MKEDVAGSGDFGNCLQWIDAAALGGPGNAKHRNDSFAMRGAIGDAILERRCFKPIVTIHGQQQNILSAQAKQGRGLLHGVMHQS